MIPKIIHLCWLSGEPYPPLIDKCIESWKEKLPNYEIKIWNCDTFDIESVRWVKEAFAAKKYAFAADYIRFFALYNYGGIYLDSDVEVIKNFDCLLNNDCFWGFEYTGIPEAAVVASIPKMEWIKNCKDWYESQSFYNEDGSMRQVVVPFLIKKEFEKYYNKRLFDCGKIQHINNIKIFPYKYFSPKNFYSGKIKIYPETFCIHHSAASWVKDSLFTKIKRYMHIILIKILGKRFHDICLIVIHDLKLNLRKRKNKSAF